jgi:hypothetical protein
MAADFSVEIVTHGRGGVIRYREGWHRCSLDWEFGGGNALAIIYAPPPDRWATEVPWAADRRDEVLDRVGREVIRQQCSRCSHVIHAGGVDILEPAAKWFT